MKLNFYHVALCFALTTSGAFAQKTDDAKGMDYRRSSLCLLLIDDAGMPKHDDILDAFTTNPIPNKFNDHNIDERIFKIDPKSLTSNDKARIKAVLEEQSNTSLSPSGINTRFKTMVRTLSESNALADPQEKEDYAIGAYKYILDQHVAKQLFDKWFIDDNGEFSVDLIRERGLYNASELDLQVAKSSLLGMAKLQDAGEELINNTFIVVSRYRYVPKEEIMNSAKSIGAAVGQAIHPIIGSGVSLATSITKTAVGDGYYVRATSFLFQLVWNDSIAGKLYSELWGDKEAYDASDIFSIRYIGCDMASAGVKAGIFNTKTESEQIRIATVNATDAVLAKLAKQYEVFRTKTPLVINERGELTSYIGTKEGVEPGDKFEVLEAVADPQTGRTIYHKRGVIKVAKGKVWQNHYMADEELAAQGETQTLTATVFEGKAKNYYTGMLLRQVK